MSLALAGSWLLLAIAWLCLPVISGSFLHSRAGKAWYLSAALAGLVGFLFAFTDLGLKLRIALCESRLTAYAANVGPETSETLHGARRVGLFEVDGTEERAGVVLLYTSRSWLNRHGLAYNPQGKQIQGRFRPLQRLYGPWYSFEWKF